MGWDLPESETPCMCGTTLRRNWEISSPPTTDGVVGRIEKPIKAYVDDARAGEVGQAYSTEEAFEQG